ncbi:hypothetical protein [Phenylobacterium sp.]|jgi:hypothetical protein|uniref:hypothetical protein n=1 Tax=Phenylobacterium sp. TaxID=1871053 RepID=UPI002F92AE76
MAALRLLGPEEGGIEESFGFTRWLHRGFVSIGLDGVSVPEPIAIHMDGSALEQWASLPHTAPVAEPEPVLSKFGGAPVVCVDAEGWIFAA